MNTNEITAENSWLYDLFAAIPPIPDGLAEAQRELRPHSLIPSRRFWQLIATAPGVNAWGYAYEGGQFNL
jgi:hypothetical protein